MLMLHTSFVAATKLLNEALGQSLNIDSVRHCFVRIGAWHTEEWNEGRRPCSGGLLGDWTDRNLTFGMGVGALQGLIVVIPDPASD
jgi:hypothetical protein